MTQVENEYTSFGHDHDYLVWIRGLWTKAGIPGPFSIAEGEPVLRSTGIRLPGAAVGLDGEANPQIAKDIAHGDTVWISEAYPGGLCHWGDKSFTSVDIRNSLELMMKNRTSFSLYVLHGGTNFGLTAGSNMDDAGQKFQPVITSYDFGAPITECGVPRESYYQFRTIIHNALHRRPAKIPPIVAMTGFSPITAHFIGQLTDSSGSSVALHEPEPIETALKQNQGIALYRATVPPGVDGVLTAMQINDIASVFLNGVLVGETSRVWTEQNGQKKTPVVIPPSTISRQLDIVVDTFGHIGYGHKIGDRKGIIGPLSVGNVPIVGWDLFGFALGAPDMVARLETTRIRKGILPNLFRGVLHISGEGGTYLDMSRWNRGYVWVNGHLLGRYWTEGPQTRIFCPAEWLAIGDNQVTVMDFHICNDTIISGTTMEP